MAAPPMRKLQEQMSLVLYESCEVEPCESCQAQAPKDMHRVIGYLQDWAEPRSGEASERWFAVFTCANKELLARQELQQQGFKVFLPQRLKTVRHARRITTRPAPIFPRYLFVRLDPERARWRAINGTRGVATLIRFGDAPTPVPRGVVEGLVAACDAHGRMQPACDLRPGQLVRLSSGPFAEFVGTLEKLDGPDAVRVLLDLMGRRVLLRARREYVLAAA